MHKRLSVVVFGLSVLGACGGGDSPPSIDDLPDFVLNAECSIEANCNQTPDEATCKSSTQLMDVQSETIIADVKAGIIKYDGNALESCFNTATAAGCNFTGFHNPDNDPCATYLTGTVAAGGACFIDLECASNGVCNPTVATCDQSTTCCPGTCAAGTTTKVAIGGACADSSECTSTAYCKGVTSTAMGTCAAVVATAGAACDSFDACANPMICNETQSGAGTCYTPGPTGGACDPTFFVLDFACSDDRQYCDATSKTCIPRVAVGATCSDAILCEGLAQCVNAKCVANGGAGATCDSSAGPGCLSGLSCTNNKCVLPAAGNSCR